MLPLTVLLFLVRRTPRTMTASEVRLEVILMISTRAREEIVLAILYCPPKTLVTVVVLSSILSDADSPTFVSVRSSQCVAGR